MRASLAVILGLAAALSSACSSGSPCLTTTSYEVVSPPRDWAADPAILDLPAASTLYALSDVHGGYARLATLLAAAGIIGDVPASPTSMRWAAGTATLVVVGDLVDKGPQGLEVIDALMALQTSAAAAGGRVVVTLGNHEAEFLADPANCKADGGDGVDAELRSHDIDPLEVARGVEPRGAWLRRLPLAARIGRWFFAHAGNTKRRGLAALERALEADLIANDYRGSEMLGTDSLLESRDWFDAPGVVADTLAALAVDHVVFGHTPKALGPAGAIVAADHGAVVRIDCGMSPDIDDSRGEILWVHADAGSETVSAISASGQIRRL